MDHNMPAGNSQAATENICDMEFELLEVPGKADDTPTIDLAFVSMNVASAAEKKRNKQIVRSTAMKSFHRKQQLQRSLESGPIDRGWYSKSKRVSHSGNVLLSSGWHGMFDISSPEGSSSDGSSSAGSSSAGSSSDGSSSDGSNAERSILRQYLSASTPASLLGAGRIDPFRIQPVDLGARVDELLDHSVCVLWPGLRPSRSDGTGSRISSAWLAKTYECPLIMHALLFGASVHLDVLRSPRSSLNNPIRLFHKVQTIRLMNAELKSTMKTLRSLDEVILAVLALGTNEVETMGRNMKEEVQSPFNSPLSSSQWLDVYGSIVHVPVHTTAMRSLVSRRGGLQNIELDSLAEVLSYSDILGATQGLGKPYWPLLVRNTIDLTQSIPTGLIMRAGRGFQDLLAFGINDSAATVLQAMVDLSVVIDHHCRGIRPIVDIIDLIDTRNAIQHGLMSLPTGEELEYGQVSSVYLYESIRHAAIIYSAAVTFPLPRSTGIFRTATTRLQNILDESKSDPCWQLCPDVLLWILVLGGIASFGTEERIWFVQNMAAVSAALNISEWEQAIEKLENYLWLGSACNSGGQLLWAEVLADRTSLEGDNIVSSF